MNFNDIYLNGIDGVTGRYLVDPFSPSGAVAAARGKPPDRDQAGWLGHLRGILLSPFLGLPRGIDPTDVTRSGWGVVFARNTPDNIRRAIEPLLAHRHGQVPASRCKVLEYTMGRSLKDWLKTYGVSTGTVDPTKVPYYLMLVGGPESIPFEFQYLLDIEYAVGRLAFDDAEGYQSYAESVVNYETASAVANAREVVYWAPRHAADPATQMSLDSLVSPLFGGTPPGDGREAEAPVAGELGYTSSALTARDATRDRLLGLLHPGARGSTPAFLFTASHGVGWPKGHANQVPAQGALLCQDWPGSGPVRPGHYLSASDVTDDASVHGLVAFHFACYGAGTLAFDPFLMDRDGGPRPVAERPFIAALPKRLLSHPRGGALAVLGHIDRAWGFSIRPRGLGPQIVPFRNLIGRVLAGEPVGHATKDFSEKYASLSASLLDALDKSRPGERLDEVDLAWAWVERNDAQNYIVLGDPAVRIRVDLLRPTPVPGSPGGVSP